MVNEIRTIFPRGLDKGFCVGSRVRHNTPEEGRRDYRSKRCEYNNEDDINLFRLFNAKAALQKEH